MQEDLDFFNDVRSAWSHEEGPSVLVGAVRTRKFDKLVPVADVDSDCLDALAALLVFGFSDLPLGVCPRVR